MSVFKDYAAYYNLLYKDKDYDSEANYIINLIEQYASNANQILDLGCGTGKHDYILSKSGYSVTGVDLSPDMIELAQQGAVEHKLNEEVKFLVGDVRDLRLSDRFDVVLSLFHVMSYQTSNSDLYRALETAHYHLKPGGVIIFDCWYGPGVLSDPPVVRVKTLENDVLEVTRIAKPDAHPNENIIDVNYHVIIKEKESGHYSEVKEKHRMRYLFKPELELLFEKFDLELLSCVEWMTDKSPSISSWNACFVVKK